jgi:hypothetical protein
MEVGEYQWVFVTVIRVNVSLFHVLQVLLVVTLTIFNLVLWFLLFLWLIGLSRLSL